MAVRVPRQLHDGCINRIPVICSAPSTGASSGTDSDPALGHPPGLFPLNRPEVMIAQAQNKFDDQGRRLTDETTRKFIGDLLVALGDWTRRLDAKAEERRRLTTPLTDERPGSGRR